MTSPFRLLGLEPRFGLELEELERRHREVSRALHPDRHAGEAASARRAALGRAIEVNHAYRALRDPVTRAEALLRERGVAVGEGHEPATSPALLMQVMEQREALAEARGHRDLETVRALAREVRRRQEEVTARLAERLDAAAGPPPLAELGELRYLRRFLEEVDACLDELGG